MKKISIVEKIEQKYVIVSSVREGACGDNCTHCKVCTVVRVETKAVCDIDVEIGDTVLIESDTLSIIIAMLSVFILPLLLPLLLYCVFGAIGVCLGIALSIALVYFISRSKAFLKRVTPKIISIVNKK